MLSPAQGYLSGDPHRALLPRQAHKQLGALCATSGWQTLSQLTSPPPAPPLPSGSALTPLRSAGRAAAALQQPPVLPPAAPPNRTNPSGAQRCAQWSTKCPSPSGSVTAATAQHLPEHPSPRPPGTGHGCFELLCQITLPKQTTVSEHNLPGLACTRDSGSTWTTRLVAAGDTGDSSARGYRFLLREWSPLEELSHRLAWLGLAPSARPGSTLQGHTRPQEG